MSEGPAAPAPHPHASTRALALGALGIVFGDIGTSPLYTLKECINPEHHSSASPADLLGVLSLIFWSLTMVVTVKYLTFIMRADNRGEGGILALLALIPEKFRTTPKGGIGWVAMLVIMGAALLYGDGMITPAISVLSALEGLEVATPAFKPIVLPATCVILLGLFAIQKRGTGDVGRIFGPIMFVWFTVIGALGAYQIAKDPAVLAALSPTHAIGFFGRHGIVGVAVLGSVVLAVTGGEALYADMGHFGARPIRISWIGLVMPALILCYFGQGALILREPHAAESPFYSMVPAGTATYALVALSAAATVIASQALISGAFSLTHQAVQLGFFPRVDVVHTSKEAEGQIYVASINWLLAVACVALVLWARESSKLAAAYGIAVTGTMAITSIVYFVVIRQTWHWSLVKAVPLILLFLAFDIPFFAANLTKFFEGGFIPIFVAAMFLIVMVTWKYGRRVLSEHVMSGAPRLTDFIEQLDVPLRVPGTGIFMASILDRVPPVVSRHAERIHTLPEHVILLTILTEHVPAWNDGPRVEVKTLSKGFYRITGRHGFMESPNAPEIVKEGIALLGLDCALDQVTYFVGHETFLATTKGRMGPITEGLFAFLTRNSETASAHFELPPDQVVELGSQIDL